MVNIRQLKTIVMIVFIFISILLFPFLLLLYIGMGWFLRRNIKQYIAETSLVRYIEKSLISHEIYKRINDYLIDIPRIHVDMKNEQIMIDIKNLYFRKRLESVKDILSSALPKNYVVRSVYLAKNENQLILEFEDLRDNSRIIYDSVYSFVLNVLNQGYEEFIIDKRLSLDLKKTPHILVTGVTGSGKSYFANNLILQAIIKNYVVYIFDYKKSYQAFEKVCLCSYSIEDIVLNLESVIRELHCRQEQMDSFLRVNPRAITTEYDFDNILVVIEEYLALVNSGIDKKTLSHIEKMILEITTLGRALGIHLMMIMQVSATTTINSSIRSNLNAKFLLGNLDDTILRTTFGIPISNEIRKVYEQGEGLCTFDVNLRDFKSSTMNFEIIDLLEYLSLRNETRST